MIQELGESTLWSALIMSIVRLGLALIWAKKYPLLCWRGQRVTAWSELTCLTIAFGGLIYAYVVSDFSLQNVTENSHSQLSLLYRIAGTWSNHEGSMLLWLWILSVYGALMAFQSDNPLNISALSIHALLIACIIIYIVSTSNPFTSTTEMLSEGYDLNPLLQDPALAIHPPILYLGYTGFSVPFCYALGASLNDNSDSLALWAQAAHRWILWAWSFLTAGIALGSLWAYYELGWGGWWFWDPVENASLLPWLTGTALLHILLLPSKGILFPKTAWLLAVGTFILCLLGFFLVRSGVLSTVHAFAYAPQRGSFLLIMIGGISLLSLWGFFRNRRLFIQKPFSMSINLPTAISILVYLLLVMTATVLLGIIYPLLMESWGGPQIAVGGPYFEKTFIPLGIGIILLMAFAGFLKGRITQTNPNFLQRIQWYLTFLLIGFAGLLLINPARPLAALGLLCGLWMIGVTLGKVCIPIKTIRWRSLFSPMIISHIGCGIMIIGMTQDCLNRQEKIVALRLGESTKFAGYTIQLKDIERYREPTYMAERAILEITDEKHLLARLLPEKRFYPSYEALITKTALYVRITSIFYVTLGGVLPGERWTVRLFYHPHVLLIWIGAAMMFLGGLKAWLNRRQKRVKNA